MGKKSKVVTSAYKLVVDGPTGGKVDAIERLLGAIAGLSLGVAADLVSGKPVFLTPSQANVARAAADDEDYITELVEVPGLETPEADAELDAAYAVIFERSDDIDDMLCRVHDGIGRLLPMGGSADDVAMCRAVILRLVVALEDVRRARETLCEGSDGWLDIEAAHITLKTSVGY